MFFSNLRFIRKVYRKYGLLTSFSLGVEYILLELAKYFPRIVYILKPKILSFCIEPTNACNLRCAICYSQNPISFEPRKKGFISWELYTKCIDELSALKHPINLGLNFAGESMLHDRFLDMISYATSKKIFRISFNTNAMLLTDEIANKLIENQVSQVVISLDGLQSKHESIRTGSDYKTVENNILQLLKRRGAKQHPRICVNLIVSDQSQEEINEFINNWTQIVDSVLIGPCLNEDVRIINSSRYFGNTSYSARHYCHWPFYYMAILWNGDVTACCHAIGGRLILGNVLEKKVMDIWNGKEYKDFRYAATSNNFSEYSPCNKCNAWNIEFVRKKSSFSDNITVEYSGTTKAYTKEQ